MSPGQRRTLEEAECGVKDQHLSRKSARDARRAMQKLTGKRFSIYRCSFCGYLHLGTMSRRRLRGDLATQEDEYGEPA